jgi:hypothetical protein
MRPLLLIGLILLAIFFVPWYRAIKGKSAPSAYGCLAQLLFLLGGFLALTAMVMGILQGMDAAFPGERRRALFAGLTRQVFQTQQPLLVPNTIQVMVESARLLFQWNLLAILGVYGLAFRLTFGRVARSSLDKKQLSIVMTAISYLATTLLTLIICHLVFQSGGFTQGVNADASQSERILVIEARLFWFALIGLAARLLSMPLSGWSPSFASFVQAASQLWVFAAFAGSGHLARWPGLLFTIAFLVGGKLFITFAEAAIKRLVPEKAVLMTIALSGFLVIIPLCFYGAWIRLANGF